MTARGSYQMPTADSAGRSLRLALLVLLALAPFAVFVNVTAVTAIEQSIGARLHVTGANLTLVVNITSIATAPFVLLAGNLGDRFGRKRVYLAGSLTFVVASVVCAVAPGFGVLLVGRALQGIGAGVLTALSLGLIATLLPSERRGLAIGAWGSGVGLGLAAGPLVGAGLTGGGSWRWLFIVVGAVTLGVGLGALALVPEARAARDLQRALDAPGALLSAAAVAAIAVGVTYGATWGWSNGRTLGVLIGGVVLLAVFAVVERRAAVPLVRVATFAIPSYSVVAVITLINLVVVIGMFVFIGLELQVNLHKSSVDEGLLYLPFSALLLVFSPAFGRLLDRVGPRAMIVLVEALAAAGLFYLVAIVITGSPTYSELLPGLVLVGLAAAAGGPTTASTLVHGHPSTRVGEGAAINGTLVQLGSAIGVGVVSGVFGARYPVNLVGQVQALRLPPAQTGAALKALATAHPPTGLPPSSAVRVLGATHLAFGHTLQGVLVALGVISVLALVLGLRVRSSEIRGAAGVAGDPLSRTGVGATVAESTGAAAIREPTAPAGR